jgi:hypothetical protein
MAFVPIKSRKRAKQLIDFGGIEFGERLWPTDFDAVIEWKDRAWLLFEVKMYDVDVPSGQRLAIERFVSDVHNAGKHAMAVVVQHGVTDPNETVTLAKCRVREIFVGGEKRWRPPNRPMNAQQIAHEYIKFVESDRRNDG